VANFQFRVPLRRRSGNGEMKSASAFRDTIDESYRLRAKEHRRVRRYEQHGLGGCNVEDGKMKTPSWRPL
jgi:hypothetical protein